MKHHKSTENVKARIILYDGYSGARLLSGQLKGFDDAVSECRRVIRHKMDDDRQEYRRWARSQMMPIPDTDIQDPDTIPEDDPE